MSPRSDTYPRPLVVKPRRRGYIHRTLIVIVDDEGVTEDGELVPDLTQFALDQDPHIWVTNDPASLLTLMVDRFRDHPTFQYQLVTSQECDQDAVMEYTKLTRFGFTRGRDKRAPGRHRGMHTVWVQSDMTRAPADIIDGNTHGALLQFGTDVRDWCQEQNIPIPTTLSGISSSLLRDSRFWPEARGRVPRATNERVRKYLPGVYQELRANTHVTYREAIGLDQRTAYHRAAQEVATPDPSTLFARGYFNDPENAPNWCQPGDVLYERTISQPGLVAARVSVPRVSKGRKFRPPALGDGLGAQVIYLWTNELDVCQDAGMTVHGLTAAWTSTNPDLGLPRYGRFAMDQVEASSEYRKRWLKPTLHATYGLLAARERDMAIGHYRGKGWHAIRILGQCSEFEVHEAHLHRHQSPVVNVTMLGVLQSEIRARSIRMANALLSEGVEVLHIHADGLHVRGAIPLLDVSTWHIEGRDNILYLDKVSWFSDQGDTLPGRDQSMRWELAKRHGALLAAGHRAFKERGIEPRRSRRTDPLGTIPWFTNKLEVIYVEPGDH